MFIINPRFLHKEYRRFFVFHKIKFAVCSQLALKLTAFNFPYDHSGTWIVQYVIKWKQKVKKKVVNLNTPPPSLAEEECVVCLSLFLPPLVYLLRFCCYLEGFVLKSAAENDACGNKRRSCFLGVKIVFIYLLFVDVSFVRFLFFSLQ